MTALIEKPQAETRTRIAAPLALLVLGALTVLSQMYVAIPLNPVLSRELGGSAAAALNTTYGLAYGIGFLIWGPVSDRYGRKTVLVPGMVMLTIATLGVATAQSLGVIAVLRMGQGFAAASFAAVALAYITEAFPARRRPMAIGAVSTAFLVAGIVGQIYGQAVGDAWGWRWVFLVAAATFTVMAVAFGVVLVEPERGGPAIALGRRFGQLGSLVTRPDLALAYAASVTVLLSFVAMYTALGTQLPADAILWVRLAGLPGMAVAPLAGSLIGRFGAARVAGAGFVIAAAGLVVEATGSLWTVAAGSVVFIAGIATLVPALITLVGTRSGQARGAGLGIYGLALFVGGSVGPQVASLPIGFPALMLGLAVLLLIAARVVTISVRGYEGADTP